MHISIFFLMKLNNRIDDRCIFEFLISILLSWWCLAILGVQVMLPFRTWLFLTRGWFLHCFCMLLKICTVGAFLCVISTSWYETISLTHDLICSFTDSKIIGHFCVACEGTRRPRWRRFLRCSLRGPSMVLALLGWKILHCIGNCAMILGWFDWFRW